MTCQLIFDERGGRSLKIIFSRVEKGVIQEKATKTGVIR